MEGDRTNRWLAGGQGTYNEISLLGIQASTGGPLIYPYTYREHPKYPLKPPISYIAKEILKSPPSYILNEPLNVPPSYIQREPMKPPPSYSLREPMKPPFSYVALAALALCQSGQKQLPISRIYSFITDHFPYYRRDTGRWQNSLRHCLSYNDCFVKASRGPGLPGRGALWSLHPGARAMFDNGSLLRRRNKFTLTQEEKERARLQTGSKGPDKLSFSISRLLDLEPADTSLSRPWTGTHSQHSGRLPLSSTVPL